MALEKNTNYSVLQESVNNAAEEAGLPRAQAIGASEMESDLSIRENVQQVAKVVSQSVSDAKSELTSQDIVGAPMTNQERIDAGLSFDDVNQVKKGMGILPDSRSMLEQSFLADSDLLPSDEIYLTKNQPIQVGTYQGKTIGSVPIFAAPAGLVPLNIIANRQKNLSKAAVKRKELRDQAISLMDIDVPEQWQNNMNDLRNEMMEEWGQITGNSYELLKDMRNPAARKFHEEIRDLQALNKTVTDANELAEELIKGSLEEDKYVPDEIMQFAVDIREGTMDLKTLMTKGGMEDFRDKMGKLKIYQNTTKTMNTQVIDKIKANTTPHFLEDFNNSTEEQKTEYKKALQVLKVSGNAGKQIWMDAIHTWYPKEDVEQVVEDVFKANNLWGGFTADEEKEHIKNAQNYVYRMLGEELKLNKTIIDAVDKHIPRMGGGYGTQQKVDPIFATIVDKWNKDGGSIIDGVTNTLAQRSKADPNSVSAHPFAEDEAVKQSIRGYAEGMNLQPMNVESGQYKARVEVGGTETWNYGSNTIRIGDIKLKSPLGGMVDAEQYLNDVKKYAQAKKKHFSDLDEKTRNMVTLLTGQVPSNDDEALALTVDSDGLMANASKASKVEVHHMVEWGGKMRVLDSDMIAQTYKKYGDQGVKNLYLSGVPTVVATINTLKWDDEGEEPFVAMSREEVKAAYPNLTDEQQQREWKKQQEMEESSKGKAKKGQYKTDDVYNDFIIEYPLTSMAQASGLDSRISQANQMFLKDKGAIPSIHHVQPMSQTFNITIEEGEDQVQN